MRTPAGTECRYYYEDYYRGREKQECRLISTNPRSEPWRPGLCHGCPVPGILRANACPHLVLEARVAKGFLGLTRYVQVTAICKKYLCEVPQPHIGCGNCHKHRPGFALMTDSDQGDTEAATDDPGRPV
ncbi:MAG: hypothetical protein C4311_03840 [Chloroflexota bacterium]